ncbi:hypothetical protein D4764_03G0001600 [Takifugu flavidus]|uniref:Uncharacterized protein n=1 Tax=Takifugu flavidus TaxID=433684 RepID=A0A5C6N6Q9_9TELE|nr:hypothetical protein D4764_03G0001600 [Takifugu flavidus]
MTFEEKKKRLLNLYFEARAAFSAPITATARESWNRLELPPARERGRSHTRHHSPSLTAAEDVSLTVTLAPTRTHQRGGGGAQARLLWLEIESGPRWLEGAQGMLGDFRYTWRDINQAGGLRSGQGCEFQEGERVAASDGDGFSSRNERQLEGRRGRKVLSQSSELVPIRKRLRGSDGCQVKSWIVKILFSSLASPFGPEPLTTLRRSYRPVTSPPFPRALIFKKPDGVGKRIAVFGASGNDLTTRAVSSEDGEALMSDIGGMRLNTAPSPDGEPTAAALDHLFIGRREANAALEREREAPSGETGQFRRF